jgi:ADP-heptose:LPS heptosyltransferase
MYRRLEPRLASSSRAAARPLKILFFSHDGKLGDAIVNTAFVAGLERWNPHCEIHVTAAGATAAFWAADDRIARVWRLDRRGWADIFRLGFNLRRERFDHIVTWLRPRSEKNRMMLWLAAPGNVIDLHDFNQGPVRHKSAACAEALAQAGAPRWTLPYDVRMTPDLAALDARYPPEREVIAVNLFAADPERNLDHDAAVRLLLGLRQTVPGAALCLSCNDATEQKARAVIAAAGTGDVVNCEGNLPQLFGLCHRAAVVISPDTAVVHIACALDTPVVGIYQDDGVKPVQWGPRGAATAVVLSRSARTLKGFDMAEVLGHVAALRRQPVRNAAPVFT